MSDNQSLEEIYRNLENTAETRKEKADFWSLTNGTAIRNYKEVVADIVDQILYPEKWKDKKNMEKDMRFLHFDSSFEESMHRDIYKDVIEQIIKDEKNTIFKIIAQNDKECGILYDNGHLVRVLMNKIQNEKDNEKIKDKDISLFLMNDINIDTPHKLLKKLIGKDDINIYKIDDDEITAIITSRCAMISGYQHTFFVFKLKDDTKEQDNFSIYEKIVRNIETLEKEELKINLKDFQDKIGVNGFEYLGDKIDGLGNSLLEGMFIMFQMQKSDFNKENIKNELAEFKEIYKAINKK